MERIPTVPFWRNCNVWTVVAPYYGYLDEWYLLCHHLCSETRQIVKKKTEWLTIALKDHRRGVPIMEIQLRIKKYENAWLAFPIFLFKIHIFTEHEDNSEFEYICKFFKGKNEAMTLLENPEYLSKFPNYCLLNRHATWGNQVIKNHCQVVQELIVKYEIHPKVYDHVLFFVDQTANSGYQDHFDIRRTFTEPSELAASCFREQVINHPAKCVLNYFRLDQNSDYYSVFDNGGMHIKFYGLIMECVSFPKFDLLLTEYFGQDIPISKFNVKVKGESDAYKQMVQGLALKTCILVSLEKLFVDLSLARLAKTANCLILNTSCSRANDELTHIYEAKNAEFIVLDTITQDHMLYRASRLCISSKLCLEAPGFEDEYILMRHIDSVYAYDLALLSKQVDPKYFTLAESESGILVIQSEKVKQYKDQPFRECKPSNSNKFHYQYHIESPRPYEWASVDGIVTDMNDLKCYW